MAEKKPSKPRVRRPRVIVPDPESAVTQTVNLDDAEAVIQITMAAVVPLVGCAAQVYVRGQFMDCQGALFDAISPYLVELQKVVALVLNLPEPVSVSAEDVRATATDIGPRPTPAPVRSASKGGRA